ncbi:MAG: hypothetical protein M3N29_01975 [Chloroflexota bacterium]|nr:hypothetical protein [Chloroflexota bacterium]
MNIALAGLVATLMATGASAASPHTGCPVGPGGAGGSTIAAWQPMNETTLAAAIAGAGFDPTEAAAVFEAGDRNHDGLLCVLVQTLPNDASGSDTWFVSKDNNVREK